ncbi:hypothetical protein LEP3755_63220 (plasmid) [Leptolyngbya sp. NIES-3755]|nr:hypothetical protein LEP3755_63220 [Leptolyngbya sp. NIES-3755]
MHHSIPEAQATEDISENPRRIYKVIKNTIQMIVMFGACLVICHAFGWMPS